MARQLVLLDSSTSEWRLDDATRATGKRGVAAARAVLATVRCGRPDGDDPDTHVPAA